nr:hypothetical protein [Candidatus Sigynarchaeota archaeon]
MKKVDNSRLKFVMLALFFLGTFLYAFNTIIQPEIERASNGTGTRESAFEWGRVRLDGKRIGCYTADASANPRTKYTAIVSMLVARGAIVTDITDAMMPVSASLLANYNIVWFDEGSGNILEPTELTSIDTWVQGGGSVLCTGDDSSSPSDEVSSKLGPYWTSFYTGTGTTTNVYGHQITQGVTSLYYSDYTWMPTADLYATLVAEVGSTEIAAAMTKGSGKAVFICDDNIFLNYTQADNYLFANNTFGWLGFKNQNAPQLTAGQVSPGNGAQNVLFSFLVTYSDSDNNEPLYVNVTVDGMVHAMSKLVPTDYNFTDGSTYSFSRYLQPGSHVFSYTCGDGTYTNTTTNINGPTVSTTNSAPPTLTNTQLNRLKGNNTTIFNFSATYTDTDNNFPSIITVSLNSTSYVLTPTNTYDFNAMDGKNYCHANTISPFGIYFYRFNCSDGLNTVSTGWYPGPEVHPYYYIGGPIEKVAIFRDQLPWGRSENELVFTANGISYDVFTSSSLGKVPLHPYNKVLIPSQQPTSFYNVLVQPNVRVWIELYVQSGGIFEMHYNHYSSDDILGTLPGGYTEVENIQDYITINPAFLSHPLITSVTQSAMNSWGDLSVDTSTSYLTGMAGTEQILMYDSLSRPRYIIRNQGTGLFIYAGLIIEYSAYYDQGPADALLQKVLLYTQNAERYWYPTLVSPANGTAMFTGTQTFKWASLAHPLVTTRYTWQLSSDSGFSSIVGQNTSILETAGNTSITIPISYPTGRYYWRVRPYYNTMVGGWSEVRFIDITYNNNAPTLTSPKVNPTSGNQDTSFTFTVVYTDSDNNAPTTMQMAINSTIYAMQKQNAGDNTYTDGCTYQFSSYLPSGIIAYYFTANDGKYSVTSSTFTNLTVGYTNVNSPVLSSPSISPMLGNNRTYVVFNITYTDADNNMPALIYAYVNGSGIALTPVQASDLNVMDGKLYTASSRLGFGKYQVLFNCSDGTRIASTAVLPGPEINPFLPVFTYDRVAIFQDQYPWGFSEIIPIVNAHSISYSIYSSASFLKVSLATFDKVIISSNQPLAFYTSLQTASVKSWFESYVASGGILEFHAASVSIALSNLPGGYNAPYQTVNSLSINASYSSHPILTGVTDTGIDNWGSSGHTYFTGFSGGEKVLIYDASSQPRMFLKNFSQGLFIYNGMPVEYAAYYNHGDGDALLTNMVLYSESLNRTALLLEPSQGSSLWNGIISFKWTRLTLDVPFVNYTWQIAATRDFSSPLSEVPTIQEVAVNTTTTQSVNYATGYYYWRVRPSYRGLLGQWSEPAWINLTRNDFAPVLSNGIYNPPTGNQLTTFNFSVIYTDADNNTPQYIRINIDGTSHGMLKAKPTDKDYTNGCSFYYLTTLSAGNHNFNYSTFDGIYPATIATQIITVA